MAQAGSAEKAARVRAAKFLKERKEHYAVLRELIEDKKWLVTNEPPHPESGWWVRLEDIDAAITEATRMPT